MTRAPRWTALATVLLVAALPGLSSLLIDGTALSGRNVRRARTPRGCASHDLPPDLASLSRRELQTVAKRAGVRANQKSVVIIAALEALRAVELDATTPVGDVALGAPPPPPAPTVEADPSPTSPRSKAKLSLESEAVSGAEASSEGDPLEGGWLLIERSLPTALRPTVCGAGRWQPWRLRPP